jgi:hypothetical protein
MLIVSAPVGTAALTSIRLVVESASVKDNETVDGIALIQ